MRTWGPVRAFRPTDDRKSNEPRIASHNFSKYTGRWLASSHIRTLPDLRGGFSCSSTGAIRGGTFLGLSGMGGLDDAPVPLECADPEANAAEGGNDPGAPGGRAWGGGTGASGARPPGGGGPEEKLGGGGPFGAPGIGGAPILIGGGRAPPGGIGGKPGGIIAAGNPGGGGILRESVRKRQGRTLSETNPGGNGGNPGGPATLQSDVSNGNAAEAHQRTQAEPSFLEVGLQRREGHLGREEGHSGKLQEDQEAERVQAEPHRFEAPHTR